MESVYYEKYIETQRCYMQIFLCACSWNSQANKNGSASIRSEENTIQLVCESNKMREEHRAIGKNWETNKTHGSQSINKEAEQ